MATRGWEHATPTDTRHRRPLATMAPGKRPRSIGGKGRVDLADALLSQIRALRLPEPQREFRPFTDRKFRIDLTWPDRLLFAEVDGGEWIIGRHSRGAGMQTDCEKWNRLTLEGWAGLRFTGSQVRNGQAIATVVEALRIR